MMKSVTVAGMALMALMALAACKSDGGNAGGAGGSGGGVGGGGAPVGGGGSGGGGAPPCDVDSCGGLIGTWDTDPNALGTFCSQASADAYDALNFCACSETAIGSGCAAICDGDQNGTGTPNFCNGVAALPQCATCLQDVCGTEYDDCSAN